MSSRHRIPLSAIPLGEGRTFDFGGRHVAVFRNRQGEAFATQPRCPHRGGWLADGLLGDSTLICPLHEWTFELRTGQTSNGECGLKTYAVQAGEDGMLTVIVDEGPEQQADSSALSASERGDDAGHDPASGVSTQREVSLPRG